MLLCCARNCIAMRGIVGAWRNGCHCRLPKRSAYGAGTSLQPRSNLSKRALRATHSSAKGTRATLRLSTRRARYRAGISRRLRVTSHIYRLAHACPPYRQSLEWRDDMPVYTSRLPVRAARMAGREELASVNGCRMVADGGIKL